MTLKAFFDSERHTLRDVAKQGTGQQLIGQVVAVQTATATEYPVAPESDWLENDFEQITSARVQVPLSMGGVMILSGVEVPDSLAVGNVTEIRTQSPHRVVKMNRLQVGDRVLVSVWGGASDYRAVITQRLRSESQSLFEPREVTNFPLTTGATERIYAGDLSNNEVATLNSGKLFSDYSLLLFVFSQTGTGSIEGSLLIPRALFTVGRDSEGLDTSFSIREFENINDTQFRSLTDNDYTEVWGIG